MNLSLKKNILATITLLFYISAFGIAAYEVSFKKGKIQNDNFTVSQSLAFGNDPALVTLFTLGTMCYIYLMILGPKKLLYMRIFLQVIVYIFLITIIWITTFKDKEKHYIFAFIIFFSILIFHILTYIVYRNQKISPLFKYGLLIACIINLLVFLGLGITRSKALNKHRKEGNISFASLENVVTLVTGAVIFIIGFC